MASPDTPRTRSQSAIAAAAKALNDATAALGDALREASTAATTTASEAVEREVAEGLRAAARTVDSVATTFSTRSRKRDRTRTELLVAAGSLFAERGYDGTSVDDVATTAGYTKGAVYSHFGSKVGLFLAVFEDASTEGLVPGHVPGTADGAHGAHGADTVDVAEIDPCVTLTHELALFALRTPESRDDAVALLAQTLERGVDRALGVPPASGATAGGGRDAGKGAPDASARRDALDALLVRTALRHTLATLSAAGVPQVDAGTVRRIIDTHDGTAGDGTADDGTAG